MLNCALDLNEKGAKGVFTQYRNSLPCCPRKAPGDGGLTCSWGGTAPRISPRERGSVYYRSRTLPNDRGGCELSGCAPPCCSSWREGRHVENAVIDHLSLRPEEKPPVCRPLLAMRYSYFSTFARNLKKLCSQEGRNQHWPIEVSVWNYRLEFAWRRPHVETLPLDWAIFRTLDSLLVIGNVCQPVCS